MIDTVIFDFDGTLADTNNLIINSFKHIYCKYYDGKCDVDYILSTFGEPLEKTLKRDFRSFKYEDVLKSYREYQVGRFGREVTLYDTVAETIKYLHEKGTKLGIATSRIKASTVEALKNFDLDKYFNRESFFFINLLCQWLNFIHSKISEQLPSHLMLFA
jgi:pyrophosphatase PpaX